MRISDWSSDVCSSDLITISWFLNGEAGAGAKAEGGVLNAQAGVRGGRNQSWTDSDIGIASEDRGRIMGTLRQLSDSRNWSNTRAGFLRETRSSSVSQVSTSSSGLLRSLTEAESCMNGRESCRERVCLSV